MPFNCASEAVRPILRKQVGFWKQIFGLARDNMKRAEAAFLTEGPDSLLPLWTKVGEPVFAAKENLNKWLAKQQVSINAVGNKFSSDESENVMASLLGQNAGQFYKGTLTQKHVKAANLYRDHAVRMLGELGMNPAEARKFLMTDLRKLRELNGDMSRFDPNNIYPKEFAPLLKDLFRGEINPAQNNAFAFMHDLANTVGRRRFLPKAMADARKEMAGWDRLRGQVHGQDLTLARGLGDDFLKQVWERQEEGARVAANFLNEGINALNKFGAPVGKVDQDTIMRWSNNMMSWYGGVAMAARPALVMRNMTQVMLPAVKTGFSELGPALKRTYGKDRDKWIRQALNDLGIPLEGEAPVFFGEQLEGPLASKLFRRLREAQKLGLRPYRWADRINNRVTTYWMGHNSIERHGKALLDKKIGWEEFLFQTGLKGSSPVDQAKIRALLMGSEMPQLSKAAREYGKTLVQDTQFIYDTINAPAMFKGTLGKMFGQFGTWPIGFTEFMLQNASAGGDWAYRTKFMGNWGIQKAALMTLGAGTGVDTSTWNYANPLTFQGGPWFQTLRDISVLGTSANQFELREASSNVRRMVGRVGTPFTGITSPFGGLATDIIQAKNADDPIAAALLALGFNLRSSKPATSR